MFRVTQWSKWAKIRYIYSQRYFEENHLPDFLYFNFLRSFGPVKSAKCYFLAIFADLAFFGPQKIVKNQNMRNLVDDFFQTTPETVQSEYQFLWATVVKVISRFEILR